MNKDTASGKFDQLAGKVKQSVGEAVGNQKMANAGAAEQVKGAAKETWGRVTDAAQDISESRRADADAKTQATGHDLREKITSTAHNVKDSISNKLDDMKRDHR